METPCICILKTGINRGFLSPLLFREVVRIRAELMILAPSSLPSPPKRWRRNSFENLSDRAQYSYNL